MQSCYLQNLMCVLKFITAHTAKNKILNLLIIINVYSKIYLFYLYNMYFVFYPYSQKHYFFIIFVIYMFITLM